MYLELQGVSHFYGKHLIFRDICCSITPSSLNLLVGANGAGKSTLLRVMAGLIKPSHGKVSLSPEIDSSKLAYLGHQSMMYPELTAIENLLFWTAWAGSEKSKYQCIEALEHVNLAYFAYEKVRTFSQGMLQKLALSRVFLLQPKVLLLDEPSTGLDISSQKMLFEKLLAIRHQGTAIIWISHNPKVDGAQADSIFCLQQQELHIYKSFSDFTKYWDSLE